MYVIKNMKVYPKGNYPQQKPTEYVCMSVYTW